MRRHFQISAIILILSGLPLLPGCGMIGAYYTAKNATCKVKINERCAKSSCRLINGILFEKLTLIKKDSIGMPADYIVTERFECYNPGVDGAQKYWPKRIYFNKTNGPYKWRADTVDVHFRIVGDKPIMVEPYNHKGLYILVPKNYDTCPIKFEKGAWYNVRIPDQRLRKVLLHIDSRGKYTVYNFGSGACPI